MYLRVVFYSFKRTRITWASDRRMLLRGVKRCAPRPVEMGIGRRRRCCRRLIHADRAH